MVEKIGLGERTAPQRFGLGKKPHEEIWVKESESREEEGARGGEYFGGDSR